MDRETQANMIVWPAVIFLTAVAILMIATCWVPVAHGSPLDCELIRNPDRRNLCRAVSKGDRTFCEFIKDHDLRSECRARVK